MSIGNFSKASFSFLCTLLHYTNDILISSLPFFATLLRIILFMFEHMIFYIYLPTTGISRQLGQMIVCCFLLWESSSQQSIKAKIYMIWFTLSHLPIFWSCILSLYNWNKKNDFDRWWATQRRLHFILSSATMTWVTCLLEPRYKNY